jgi:glycosyltransferase involved in cell wall biosynthesis
MAAGLPVVGIRSPGVGDTVEDGVSGLLAPKEDLADFTARLARMIGEVDNRKRMGEQARAAAQSYAIERTAQILLEKYEQLLQTTRPKGQKRLVRQKRKTG